MKAWAVLAGLWITPAVLVLVALYVDRALERRRAARRLAAAREAFWTSLAAFVERAREDIDTEAHFRLWDSEVEG